MTMKPQETQGSVQSVKSANSTDSSDTKENIVCLDAFRKLKLAHQDHPEYEFRLMKMSKPELLEEMVRFQQERSQCGELTLSMILRGRILFQKLEENAETRELQILTRSYKRHLEFELESFLKNQTVSFSP